MGDDVMRADFIKALVNRKATAPKTENSIRTKQTTAYTATAEPNFLKVAMMVCLASAGGSFESWYTFWANLGSAVTGE